ncbi:hypothetical protein FNV43_RR19385 [Rhamnella rubrinervis]|uniref:Uncharacterized protein n=1 Tax=Rhamnella rubrinervis TaxID=2594499 RepID=A0A8K0DZ42_9ROSA|nr:hypothetical protein FNV43_RR19385 [Rhamnella rubrinervis]
MDITKFGKTLKYPEAKDEQVHITNKTALFKVWEEIKGELSKDRSGMKKMEDSCLKQFLKLGCVNFSADIVHHLLRSQTHIFDKKHMEFNFGGKIAQFSKKFGLITGLKMGPILKRKTILSFDRIQDDYFNNLDKITNAMVNDIFTHIVEYMENDDMVKSHQSR